MATVTETYDSRSTDERGINGIFAKRSFIVTSDNATDDPIDTILADEDANVAVGTLHPDPNYPIFVTHHRKSRRIAPKSYLVDVHYGITTGTGDILSHPDFPGWQVRMSSMNEQIQQTHTVDWVNVDGTQFERPKLIGFPAYQKEEFSETGGNSNIFYKTTGANGVELIQNMAVIGGTKKRQPQTTFRSKAAMSLVKVFDSFNYVVTSPARLSSHIGKVNNTTFLGLTPGLVKFIFWSVDAQAGNTSTGSSGYRFTFQLDFELDFTTIVNLENRSQIVLTGHSPIQLAHTWTDEDGTEYPLFDSSIEHEDKRVLENFHVAQSFDINAVLGIIESVHGGGG